MVFIALLILNLSVLKAWCLQPKLKPRPHPNQLVAFMCERTCDQNSITLLMILVTSRPSQKSCVPSPWRPSCPPKMCTQRTLGHPPANSQLRQVGLVIHIHSVSATACPLTIITPETTTSAHHTPPPPPPISPHQHRRPPALPTTTPLPPQSPPPTTTAPAPPLQPPDSQHHQHQLQLEHGDHRSRCCGHSVNRKKIHGICFDVRSNSSVWFVSLFHWFGVRDPWWWQWRPLGRDVSPARGFFPSPVVHG